MLALESDSCMKFFRPANAKVNGSRCKTLVVLSQSAISGTRKILQTDRSDYICILDKMRYQNPVVFRQLIRQRHTPSPLAHCRIKEGVQERRSLSSSSPLQS